MYLVQEMVCIVVLRVVFEPELHLTDYFVIEREINCDILELVKFFLNIENLHTWGLLEV